MTTLTSVAAVAAQTLANMTKASQIYGATMSDSSNTNKAVDDTSTISKEYQPALKNGCPSSITSRAPQQGSEIIYPLLARANFDSGDNDKLQGCQNSKNSSSPPQTSPANDSNIAIHNGIQNLTDKQNDGKLN